MREPQPRPGAALQTRPWRRRTTSVIPRTVPIHARGLASWPRCRSTSRRKRFGPAAVA